MDALITLLKQYGLSDQEASAYATDIHAKAGISRTNSVPPLRPEERADLAREDALQTEAYTPVANSAVAHFEALKSKMKAFTDLHARVQQGDALSPAEQRFYNSVRSIYDNQVRAAGKAAGQAVRNGPNVTEFAVGSPGYNEIGARASAKAHSPAPRAQGGNSVEHFFPLGSTAHDVPGSHNSVEHFFSLGSTAHDAPSPQPQPYISPIAEQGWQVPGGTAYQSGFRQDNGPHVQYPSAQPVNQPELFSQMLALLGRQGGR